MLLYAHAEITLEKLREMLTAQKKRTFLQCGDIVVAFQDCQNKVLKSHMLIAYSEAFGYYMHHYDFRTKQDKLSLWDRERLMETIDYDTDCFVSLGLFVPIENALPEIIHFAKTGDIGDTIGWIDPSEIPESGNWA